MMTALAKSDARALMNEIQTGLAIVDNSLVDLRGKCLRFRDGEGWRALGYKDLKSCITREFGFNESRFFQLTRAAEIAQDIDCTVVQSLPSERALRPLAKLGPKQRKAAYKQAVKLAEEENDERPVVTERHTNAAVRKVVNSAAAIDNGQDAKTAKVYDGRNKTVHLDKLVPIFRQADEFKALMQMVSVLKAKMNGLALTSAGTVLKSEMNRATQHLDNVRAILKFSKPHSICVYCDGKGKDCSACHGTGWITRAVFDMAPKEMKK